MKQVGASSYPIVAEYPINTSHIIKKLIHDNCCRYYDKIDFYLENFFIKPRKQTNINIVLIEADKTLLLNTPFKNVIRELDKMNLFPANLLELLIFGLCRPKSI